MTVTRTLLMCAVMLSGCAMYGQAIDGRSAIAIADRTCSRLAKFDKINGVTPIKIEDWKVEREQDHWHAWVPDRNVSVDIPNGFHGRQLKFSAACAYIVLE